MIETPAILILFLFLHPVKLHFGWDIKYFVIFSLRIATIRGQNYQHAFTWYDLLSSFLIILFVFMMSS